MKAEFREDFLNPRANLPHGLTPGQVGDAIRRLYEYLHAQAVFAVTEGYLRLETLLLGNALSGFVSEVFVKNVDEVSPSLQRNRKVGGFPDLLPTGAYPDDTVLHGDEGIEVKATIQPGGWQGHNPETGWVMVVRYTRGEEEAEPYEMPAVTVVQVLAALMEDDDWSFSGRGEGSRRTITASITASGMEKLRSNPIYQDPEFVVARKTKDKERYRRIGRGLTIEEY